MQLFTNLTTVNQPLPLFTNSYNCLKTVETVYKPLQLYTHRYNCLQTVKTVYTPLKLYTNRCNCLQNVATVSKPLQLFTNRYNFLQDVTNVCTPLQLFTNHFNHKLFKFSRYVIFINIPYKSLNIFVRWVTGLNLWTNSIQMLTNEILIDEPFWGTVSLTHYRSDLKLSGSVVTLSR